MIRLLGRDTVEEIVYSRAVSKLRLTSTVIEEGRFSLLEQPQAAAPALQVPLCHVSVSPVFQHFSVLVILSEMASYPHGNISSFFCFPLCII